MESAKEKLAESNCQVVIVGYGEMDSGKKWKKDVVDSYKIKSFELYMDLKRSAYERYGIGRTFSKVCCRETIYDYVSNFLIPNTGLMEGYKGDDVLQDGGDVVLNQHGETVYTYIGNAADRPSIQHVLEFLAKK